LLETVVAILSAGVAVYLTSDYSGAGQAVATIAAGLGALLAVYLLAYPVALASAPLRQRDELRRVIERHIVRQEKLTLAADYAGGVLTCRVTNDHPGLTAIINVCVPDGLGLTVKRIAATHSPPGMTD